MGFLLIKSYHGIATMLTTAGKDVNLSGEGVVLEARKVGGCHADVCIVGSSSQKASLNCCIMLAISGRSVELS